MRCRQCKHGTNRLVQVASPSTAQPGAGLLLLRAQESKWSAHNPWRLNGGPGFSHDQCNLVSELDAAAAEGTGLLVSQCRHRALCITRIPLVYRVALEPGRLNRSFEQVARRRKRDTA